MLENFVHCFCALHKKKRTYAYFISVVLMHLLLCAFSSYWVYMWDAWLFNCSISNCGKARALNHPKKQKLLLCIKIYDCIYYPFCTFSAPRVLHLPPFPSFSLIRFPSLYYCVPFLLFSCVIEHSPFNSRAASNDVLREIYDEK